MELNNRKVIRAWTFYDSGNSAYSLIITSAIFPIYYSSIAPESIHLFSHSIHRSVMASYAISFSFLLIAILSPLLSSIADYYGNKKAFMKFFCYLGALACMGMFFFTKNETTNQSNVIYGLLCSVIASVGYCGSLVFYNAFLPEIASKDKQDAVSARGFAMGYVGSVALMVLCFVVILLNDQYHWMKDNLPPRISFVAVGLWWIGFAQISFHYLKEKKLEAQRINHAILFNGYHELKTVFHELKTLPQLQRFLFSFFFYNMGVQTVMYMATYFAKDELKLETLQLLMVVLIIQLVAIVGAYLFSLLSKVKGNILSLVVLVILWILICYAAYFVKTVNAFYALAFSVGMVMGGIQSLSRSTYAKMLPQTNDTASYFSFFDVCDKLGIVIGTLSFGLVADLMGGMRNSVVIISLYFIFGLFLLWRVKFNRTS